MAAINKASIWITLVILVYKFNLLSCKQQMPKHDEIERVFNETYSVIWKCSVSECHPGSGLSFPCGTTIPFSESIECVDCLEGVNFSDTNDYSQCKSCRKCSPHEKSSGHCTTTEDTTRCLKMCNKGFYWNNVTDSCDPCSDCCEQPFTRREKQCEDSGLAVSHQCRQTHVKCQRPMVRVKTAELVHNDEQNGLSFSSITGIIVGCVLLALIVIGFVLWQKWQHVKNILKRCCCFSRGKTYTIYFFTNPEDNKADLESGPFLPVNGSGSDVGEVKKKGEVKGLLTSDVPDARKPGYFRELSVPLESRDPPKAKTAFHRSKSHPGCIKDYANKETLKETGHGSPKKCHSSWREKKSAKKAYRLVLANPELPDPAGIDLDVEGNECSSTVVTEDHSPAHDDLTHSSNQPSSFLNSHEFQKHLLTRKMETIPFQPFFCNICNKLDVERRWGDDYRTFGERIGLSRDEISVLGQRGQPTHSMLQKFDSQKNSSIGKFKNIMEGMERHDVVTILDEWISCELGKLNN